MRLRGKRNVASVESSKTIVSYIYIYIDWCGDGRIGSIRDPLHTINLRRYIVAVGRYATV